VGFHVDAVVNHLDGFGRKPLDLDQTVLHAVGDRGDGVRLPSKDAVENPPLGARQIGIETAVLGEDDAGTAQRLRERCVEEAGVLMSVDDVGPDGSRGARDPKR
jgi:hypothetical protein